ncbi:hypothetical protein Geu3261_0058_007 [Komagataeibacter europaeus NBRC 3261]|uniref:Uncharacterized protein n=1 Tax=Komagataeibacter europaeus NBRC 3261 TaxID=1234669 RepID=A0A0D6PYM2_KOMEU|nr:hypothetical protein Geu3261_0058_007 [Komagataeibacter europaeus NBRC 3261]
MKFHIFCDNKNTNQLRFTEWNKKHYGIYDNDYFKDITSEMFPEYIRKGNA